MIHSRLAASLGDQFIGCPGSIAYVEHLKAEGKIAEDESSPASELGTGVHAVIEYCGKLGINPQKIGKELINVTKQKIGQHEINSAEIAYKYARLMQKQYGEVLFEERYPLDDIYDIDIGGTTDLVGLKKKKVLHTADYKNGRGLVEHMVHPQQRIYSLGAYYNEDHWMHWNDKTIVRNTIIQPNAYHPEGRIRTDEYTIKELRKWEEKKLIPAIELIKTGTTTLTPGDKQCLWCDARRVCPANAKQTLKIAKLDFKDVPARKKDMQTPDTLTNDELAFTIQNTKRIQNFLEGAEKEAFARLEKGERIGDLKIQDKFGNRRMIGKNKFQKVLKSFNVKPKKLILQQDPKMMTLTDIRTYLKKEKHWQKNKIERFISQITYSPIIGKQLRIEQKTTDFDHIEKLED